MPSSNTMVASPLDANGISDQLKANGVPENLIDIQDGYLMIHPPGIRLGDIASFLKNTLAEFGELADLIPSKMPLAGVAIASLKFRPNSDQEPYLLQLTLSWATADWQMIPGVVALEAPKIDIQVEGGRISGSVTGVVEIENISLLLEGELPNETLSIRLAAAENQQLSAKELLQKFQVKPGGNKPGSGIELGALTLDDLSLLGSIKDRRGLFHLALGKIKIGPGDMALQLTLDYTGGTNSRIAGSVWGEYDIFKKDDPNTKLFALLLLAEYDGPEQGWLFSGSETSGSTNTNDSNNNTAKPASVAELIQAFDPEVKDIPAFLRELAIRFLNLSYNTGTGDFAFSLEVDTDGLFGPNAEVDMIAKVDLRKVGAGATATYEKTFSGQLIFKMDDGFQMEFDILFNKAPASADRTSGETTFLAAYKNQAGGKINIGRLLQKLDPSFYIPITIDVQDAFFAYDSKGNVGADFLFGLDIGSGINLSNLPLIGKIFPQGQSLTLGIQPLVAKGPTPPFFSATRLAELESLVPGGGIKLPTTDIKENVGLGINLQLGDKSFHFELPLQLASNKTTPKTPPPAGQAAETTNSAQSAIEEKPAAAGSPTQTATSPATTATTPPPPGDSGDGIQWINLQQNFGPVQFNRIGLQYADKKIWAFLDAGLSLAGLTINLDGLGVGTPINKLDPEFKLLGISLDYAQGPIEIGGSFLRYEVEPTAKTPGYDEFDGMATLKAEILNLTAIGSYAKVDGHTSLFIYAILNYPLGGPPFFFVTGLAAGFGYNRAVRVPAISEVAQFPLVNEAVGGEGTPLPRGLLARRNYLQTEITKLRTAIYPKIGEYFLAAGIRFSTFELIDSFVMVVVSFGEHFELDILGISTLIAPTPQEGQTVAPLAELQLELKAAFIPDEGFLGIQAQLTNNSFLLSRDCRLMGGFAFFTWFAGEHKGDFVISLGGYHPEFDRPAWYPTVPRLGFNWIISSELSIKGDAYFALCSHALMAGGSLAAVFKTGNIKAWFIIAADFIVSWKPYFYKAEMKLDMGVSVTIWAFGTRTITLRLWADLKIWGPDFSGKAKVHLWIISFTISFGRAEPKPRPIDWATFQGSFLPKPEKICAVSVTGGLVKQLEIPNQQGQKSTHYVINPRDFQLALNTPIPFKEVLITDKGSNASHLLSVDQLQQSPYQGKERLQAFQWNGQSFVQVKGQEQLNTAKIGIAPMALDEVKAKLELSISRLDTDKNSYVYAGEDFALTPIVKKMPAALWGGKLTPKANSQQFIEPALTGFQISPAAKTKPGFTQSIPKRDLQYTTDHVDRGFRFEKETAFVAEPGVVAGKDFIRNHIAGKESGAKRKAILEALGFDYAQLHINTPADLADDFVRDPQIGIFA
ncbi:MAG: DUF6603 domain-containing protein [Bacteroidota bacterium]